MCKHGVKYVRYNKKKKLKHLDNNILSLEHNCKKFHAEIGALKKCDLSELYGCSTTLIVIRINKQGILKMSKPCFHCIKFMNKVTKKYNFNIKIYYSTDDGKIVFSSLYDLTNNSNNYVSSGFKNN